MALLNRETYIPFLLLPIFLQGVIPSEIAILLNAGASILRMYNMFIVYITTKVDPEN